MWVEVSNSRTWHSTENTPVWLGLVFTPSSSLPSGLATKVGTGDPPQALTFLA